MLDQVEWNEAACELRAPMEPGFAVFKGAFGGWTAALSLLAAQRLSARHSGDAALTPLSLNIEYIKGFGEGSVAARPSVESASRSTHFMRVQTWHADALCAVSSVVLSRRRATARVESASMPPAAAPESLPSLASMPKPATWTTPVTWIERFDMRPVSGTLFQPAPAMGSLMWSRAANGRSLDHAGLAALADANFPRIFYHYGAPSPIATVTMSVHFHALAHDLEAVGSDFVLMQAHNSVARDGFFDQQVRIWSRAGVLLASSSQLVWFDASP